MKRVAYKTINGKRSSVSLTEAQNEVVNRLCERYNITKQRFIEEALRFAKTDNKSEFIRDHIIDCLMGIIIECGGNI